MVNEYNELKNQQEINDSKNSTDERFKETDISRKNIDLKKAQADELKEVEDAFVQEPGDKAIFDKISHEIDEVSKQEATTNDVSSPGRIIMEFSDDPSNKHNQKFHQYVKDLISEPGHPLHSLYREKDNKYQISMDAGHMISHKAATQNGLALEMSRLNRSDGHVEKTIGLEKQSILIKGVPVEQITAEYLEQQGILEPGTVEAATIDDKGYAWNPIGGIIAYKDHPDRDMFTYPANENRLQQFRALYKQEKTRLASISKQKINRLNDDDY